ncbi:MAG: hypothetical protein LBT86_02945 [Deltaproteobacteria bacterium]|nr:hypothetical protein [Deltaproteobacteria bacterium]
MTVYRTSPQGLLSWGFEPERKRRSPCPQRPALGTKFAPKLDYGLVLKRWPDKLPVLGKTRMDGLSQ